LSDGTETKTDKKRGMFSGIIEKLKGVFKRESKPVKFIDEKTVEKIVSTPTRVPDKSRAGYSETSAPTPESPIRKRIPLPPPSPKLVPKHETTTVPEKTDVISPGLEDVSEEDIQLIKLEKEKQIILDELDLIELKYKEGEITAQERDRRYVELINKLFKIKREIRRLKQG